MRLPDLPGRPAVTAEPPAFSLAGACAHDDVRAVALFSDVDLGTFDERGIPLRPPPGRDAVPGELIGVRVTGRLGVCRGCHASLVSLRLADYDNPATAWTVRWAPAVRDATPRASPP
jgi:hypothetical protein